MIADHAIDIGPEGGAGDTIMAQGRAGGQGHTGRFLAEELKMSKYGTARAE